MPRSKSRRTRRRVGGQDPNVVVRYDEHPYAGAKGWLSATQRLGNLTQPGGCAMMLGKRGTLFGRSGPGGEYGKIAAGKMYGYDGKTNNKMMMMNFNLGCDKGNGEKQLKKAWAQADFDTRAAFLNKAGIKDVVAAAQQQQQQKGGDAAKNRVKNEENQDANRAEKERSRANDAAVDRLKFIIKKFIINMIKQN